MYLSIYWPGTKISDSIYFARNVSNQLIPCLNRNDRDPSRKRFYALLLLSFQINLNEYFPNTSIDISPFGPT